MPISPSDLRGWTRLTTDGTHALVNAVQAVHDTVLARACLRVAPIHVPIAAVTHLVYRALRVITSGVGDGADLLLARVAPLLPAETEAIPAREGIVAVVNGVLGDHLAESRNPLAIAFGIRSAGVLLDDALASLPAQPPPTGKLLLLAHGLCMGPHHWTRGGFDRAAAVGADLGYTPLHLQYNSGLHVSVNGRALADRLETLVRTWPVPVESLTIIGHSMGGLVARSAVHYGSGAQHAWRRLPLSLVFLGTPHHGAPLERQGFALDHVLHAVVGPLGRIGRLRSAGITDLRHGNVLDEDWTGQCRFAHAHDTRPTVPPLPADVRAFAIAGSRGSARRGRRSPLPGDGLVPVDSALGRHPDASRDLRFPPSNAWIAFGTGHLELLANPAVFRRIRRWLSAPQAADPTTRAGCRSTEGPRDRRRSGCQA